MILRQIWQLLFCVATLNAQFFWNSRKRIPLPSHLFENGTLSTVTKTTASNKPITKAKNDMKDFQTLNLTIPLETLQGLSSKMSAMTKKYISSMHQLNINGEERSFLRHHTNKCSDNIKRTHSLTMLPLNAADTITACLPINKCLSTNTLHITNIVVSTGKQSTCSKEVMLVLYRNTKLLTVITWMLKMALSLQLELITLPDNQHNQTTININLNELNSNFPLIILAPYGSIRFSSSDTVTLQKLKFSCQKTETSQVEMKLTKIMILMSDPILDLWYEYPYAGYLSHDPTKGNLDPDKGNYHFLENRGVKWSDWDTHVTKFMRENQQDLLKHVSGDMDGFTAQKIFNLSQDILLPIRNENVHISTTSPATIDVNFILKLATFLREISFNFSSKSLSSTHYWKELDAKESLPFVEFTSCMTVSFPFSSSDNNDPVTQANNDSSSYEVAVGNGQTENVRNFASAAFASSKIICSLYELYLESMKISGEKKKSGENNKYNVFLQSLQSLLDPFQQPGSSFLSSVGLASSLSFCSNRQQPWHQQSNNSSSSLSSSAQLQEDIKARMCRLRYSHRSFKPYRQVPIALIAPSDHLDTRHLIEAATGYHTGSVHTHPLTQANFIMDSLCDSKLTLIQSPASLLSVTYTRFDLTLKPENNQDLRHCYRGNVAKMTEAVVIVRDPFWVLWGHLVMKEERQEEGVKKMEAMLVKTNNKAASPTTVHSNKQEKKEQQQAANNNAAALLLEQQSSQQQQQQQQVEQKQQTKTLAAAAGSDTNNKIWQPRSTRKHTHNKHYNQHNNNNNRHLQASSNSSITHQEQIESLLSKLRSSQSLSQQSLLGASMDLFIKHTTSSSNNNNASNKLPMKSLFFISQQALLEDAYMLFDSADDSNWDAPLDDSRDYHNAAFYYNSVTLKNNNNNSNSVIRNNHYLSLLSFSHLDTTTTTTAASTIDRLRCSFGSISDHSRKVIMQVKKLRQFYAKHPNLLFLAQQWVKQLVPMAFHRHLRLLYPLTGPALAYCQRDSNNSSEAAKEANEDADNADSFQEQCLSLYGTRQYRNDSANLNQPPPALIGEYNSLAVKHTRQMIEHVTGVYSGASETNSEVFQALFPGEDFCGRRMSIIHTQAVSVSVAIMPTSNEAGDVLNIGISPKKERARCRRGVIYGYHRGVIITTDPFVQLFNTLFNHTETISEKVIVERLATIDIISLLGSVILPFNQTDIVINHKLPSNVLMIISHEAMMLSSQALFSSYQKSDSHTKPVSTSKKVNKALNEVINFVESTHTQVTLTTDHRLACAYAFLENTSQDDKEIQLLFAQAKKVQEYFESKPKILCQVQKVIAKGLRGFVQQGLHFLFPSAAAGGGAADDC